MSHLLVQALPAEGIHACGVMRRVLTAFNMDAREHKAEFDRQQGCDSVTFGEEVLFANGASRDTGPIGFLRPPPKDEYERLSKIVWFHRARLTNAVQRFNDRKERLALTDCPSKEEIDGLKELQTSVSQFNQSLEAAKQALANTETGKRLEQNRQDAAEHRQRQQEARQQVCAIRV